MNDSDKLKLLQNIFEKISPKDVEKYLPFVDDAISTLDEREQCVLQKRFSGKTLAETGKTLIKIGTRKSKTSCEGVTRERVRQIEAKALRKLRQPQREKILKGEWTAAQMMKYTFKNALTLYSPTVCEDVHLNHNVVPHTKMIPDPYGKYVLLDDVKNLLKKI